jgi:hypothetical protein
LVMAENLFAQDLIRVAHRDDSRAFGLDRRHRRKSIGPSRVRFQRSPGAAQRHQMYIRSEEELRKVFEWESGSISKRHARRTVWPQVIFHTRPILGIGR